jgi:diguanylate cyclase (GGDEF)-like protein
MSRLLTRKPAASAAPTLLSVLRQGHLGMALGGVAIVGASLVLPAAIALHIAAEHDLNLAARAMRYTTEAAVVFKDRDAAREALVSIATAGDVAEAAVYDRDGALLADWHNRSDTLFARMSEAAAALLGESAATIPVVHEGETVGHIRLRGSGQMLLGFLIAGAAGIAACQALLVLGALYLSRRILGRIAKPLAALTRIADTVRRQRGSGHRVPAAEIAELNALAETFNALFDELDAWEASARHENAQLAHKAHHDSLTGLPNRAVFEERLSHALADADQRGTSVAVLFMDSNGFKQINDRLGHAAGDAVLVNIAARVKDLLREEDLVARLGGDEFAVLLTPVRTLVDAQHIADAIAETVLRPMLLPGGDRIATSLSIGIALYPQHAGNAAALLQNADTAMYRAKRNRMGGWEVALTGQVQDDISMMDKDI